MNYNKLMDNMLFTNDVATLLGVTRQQVLIYVKKGLLNAVQYEARGHYRFKKQEVLDFKNGKK